MFRLYLAQRLFNVTPSQEKRCRAVKWGQAATGRLGGLGSASGAAAALGQVQTSISPSVFWRESADEFPLRWCPKGLKFPGHSTTSYACLVKMCQQRALLYSTWDSQEGGKNRLAAPVGRVFWSGFLCPGLAEYALGH